MVMIDRDKTINKLYNSIMEDRYIQLLFFQRFGDDNKKVLNLFGDSIISQLQALPNTEIINILDNGKEEFVTSSVENFVDRFTILNMSYKLVFIPLCYKLKSNRLSKEKGVYILGLFINDIRLLINKKISYMYDKTEAYSSDILAIWEKANDMGDMVYSGHYPIIENIYNITIDVMDNSGINMYTWENFLKFIKMI